MAYFWAAFARKETVGAPSVVRRFQRPRRAFDWNPELLRGPLATIAGAAPTQRQMLNVGALVSGDPGAHSILDCRKDDRHRLLEPCGAERCRTG